jgi:hypothetical protein
MMDMLKKLVRFIGLDSSRKIEFDSFIIGLQVFLVFDLRCNKNIIINQIIEKVLLNHKVYWFKEVKEFEEYYDIISFEDSDYIFIIIG